MPRPSFRAVLLALFVSALIFGLSACGGSSSSEPGDGDTELTDNDGNETAADGDGTEAEVAADGDKESVENADETEAPGDGDTADQAEHEQEGESVGDGDSEAESEAESENEADGETPDYHWTHWPITLNDPVQTGNDVRSAIDSTAFAIDTANKRLFSDFDWDITDNHPYLWQADMQTRELRRVTLTGTPFLPGENFCNGENWCQFFGYDTQHDTLLVIGPRAQSIMRVTKNYVASLTAVSGTPPANGAIGYSHAFAWGLRKLFVYGYLLSSGAGQGLYSLDLDSGEWRLLRDQMMPVADNCLAYDEDDGQLYSFGGTTDGESDTSLPLPSYAVIDPVNGHNVSWSPLPQGLAGRALASCAYDAANKRFVLFGGAQVNDYFDETKNLYHNDTWLFDPLANTFTQVFADLPTGTYTEPDSYGDIAFDGFPGTPNFGKNRGLMQLDASSGTLWLLGEIPRSGGLHYFTLPTSDL